MCFIPRFPVGADLFYFSAARFPKPVNPYFDMVGLFNFFPFFVTSAPSFATFGRFFSLFLFFSGFFCFFLIRTGFFAIQSSPPFLFFLFQFRTSLSYVCYIYHAGKVNFF